MKDGRHFALNWLICSFVFYFIPYLLPNMVVTGNVRLAPFMASVISGFLLTVGAAISHPALASLKIKLKDVWQSALAYLFVNVLGVWVIARYADLTGIGVANAWIAVMLGVLFTLVQIGLHFVVLKENH